MLFFNLESMLGILSERELQELAHRLAGQREFYESNDDGPLALDADLAYVHVWSELERRHQQLRFDI